MFRRILKGKYLVSNLLSDIHSFIGTKEGFSENNLSSCLRPLCSLLTRQITNKKAREEKEESVD